MAQIVRKSIADHTGGVNLSYSDEIDTPAVLKRAVNARTVEYGTVQKRAATQRIHVSAIGDGGEVQSLFYWDGPEGPQVVAIAGGDFYHKTEAQGEFQKVPLGIDPAIEPNFVTHQIGGVPNIFFADGVNLYYFDGISVAQVPGAPPLRYLRVYNTRLFGINDDRFLYYSAIDQPLEWSVAAGAGQAAVETYDADPLTALHVVGSSLLCFKGNSISRFTGYDVRDVVIATETAGVTSEVGTIAPSTVRRVEDVLFFLSDRGPYLATESGIRFIGLNVETVFENLTLQQLSEAHAGHNRLRREVWLALPDADDPQNVTVWRYNYRMDSWWGPDTYVGYDPASLARYERGDGSESILIGGYDGFVRDADVIQPARLDDVLRDGTLGSPIPMELEYREVDFGSKEYMKLMFIPQTIVADLELDGQLVLTLLTDIQPARTVNITTRGPLGYQIYRFRPGLKGRALFPTFTETTKSPAKIQRVDWNAKLGRRRWI